MTSFLVEAYTAGMDALTEMEARAREAADEITRSGTPVRYERSIFVPEDEICFHLFDAASLEVVQQASDRAHLAAQRIVEAIQGDS